LPAPLAGSVDLIPELLNVSRANATVKTYHLGFIRLQINPVFKNGIKYCRRSRTGRNIKQAAKSRLKSTGENLLQKAMDTVGPQDNEL
jgi:hypothetical protein